MILDIDHIALCLNDFELAKNTLSSLGYQCNYSIYQKPNLTIKRDLMKNYSELHDFALFKLKNSLGIEIINHEKINKMEPCIMPIFENVDMDMLEDCSKNKKFKNFNECKIKEINLQCYIKNSQEGFRFNKIVLFTSDLQASKKFWKNFGFNDSDTENDVIEFSSILNNIKYQFYLQEKPKKIPSHHLDDFGLNCVAFISNSLKNEKTKLEQIGIKTTEIDELRINDKFLRTFFCQGPSGELVEIISP